MVVACGGPTRTRRESAAGQPEVTRSADGKNVYTVIDFREALSAPLDRIEEAATKVGCTHVNRLANGDMQGLAATCDGQRVLFGHTPGSTKLVVACPAAMGHDACESLLVRVVDSM